MIILIVLGFLIAAIFVLIEVSTPYWVMLIKNK